MNDSSIIEYCPCGSGFLYTQCCGAPQRNAVNADILAKVSNATPLEANNLSTQLRTALNYISSNPDLFPARINFLDDRAFFIKMSPRWYRESVFLDPARIKGTCVIQSDLDWLKSVADHSLWQPTGLIFHTAFCGSTLMAQSLDAVFNCLPLREPEVLGNLLFHINSKNSSQQSNGIQNEPQWMELIMRLLSRRYEPRQSVVIKANDYANPLMIKLLDWRRDLPVLFMYTPLAEFLAGCLKADNRRDWIASRYKTVSASAAKLFDYADISFLEDNAYGEMAAVYWAFNIQLFHNAWLGSAPKLRSLDFNTMLANPLECIQTCGQLFQLEPLVEIDTDIEINKLFGVYSKNKNFKYSPQQRDHDIHHVLENHPTQRQTAENLARRLLQQNYPDNGLPGDLLA